MITREHLLQAGNEKGVDVRFWGRFGVEPTEALEAALGVRLPSRVRNFAQSVGNVMIGPFSLVVCGDDTGEFSCATETLSLRERHLLDLHPEKSKLIKVLDDAGESFFCNGSDPSVLCYETRRIVPGEEIHSFPSFDEFLGWLFEQARETA